MARDTRYLIHRGNQWIVNVKVPKALRGRIGKAHLRHPLHTDSLARANALKHRHVADLKDIIRQAEQHEERAKGADNLTTEAMQWRHDIARAGEDPGGYLHPDPDGYDENAQDLMTSLLAERAEEIEQAEGLAKAREFHAIATGSATPIAALVDQWIAERPMKPRQQTDYRRAVTKFTVWLAAGKHPEAIERITRKIVGRYVSEAFVAAGVHHRTANKDISCLGSLWKWSERKGIVPENVWRGQSLAKQEPTKAEAKRPFTDDEIKTLFNGKPSPLLRDFMTIAALSGMRVEEIARLTVGDIVRDCFDITKAKTKAGERMVPIHSAVAPIVHRRTAGKAPGEPLFPELPIPKEGSPIERSQKIVKAFTTYRRKVGVDDVPPGARQSRVDFHSFRRFFITKAEQAGQQPHWIESLVGHKRSGMSLGRYSAGPLIEQMRGVVESVKLPDEQHPDRTAFGNRGEASEVGHIGRGEVSGQNLL